MSDLLVVYYSSSCSLVGAPSISPLEPPHCQLRHAVRDLASSTTGVIGYVQIYPGGTERLAKKKGGVAGRSCMSREKEMLCSLGAGNKCNVNGLIGLGVVVKAATVPRN